MADLPYHAAILGAAHRASGRGRLAAPDATATVDNPLCGDRVTIDLRRAAPGGPVSEIGQVVRGCVLCEAAAVLIVEAGTGAAEAELRAAAESVRAMLATGAAPDPPAAAPWEKAAMFLPVHAHKSRHDCVLLPFRALLEALGR